jgi:hypothetical protein
MGPITVVLPRPRTADYAPSGSASSAVAFRRTVSMTAGADEPLRVLADAPAAASVSCHPCDEAIVRHLVGHVGRLDCALHVDPEVAPGVLAVSVRLAVVS